MNIVKKLFAAALCSLAVGAANATIIKVDQTINPDPDQKVTSSAPVSLFFDLRSRLAAGGVTSQDIFAATLDIFLTDPYDGQERYVISIGGGVQTVNGNGGVQNGISERLVSVGLLGALADLQQDGMLQVVISQTANNGDFDFARATLEASYNEPVDVPEPASAALLGLGMLGFLAARRRRA